MRLEILYAVPWDGDLKLSKALLFFHLKYERPIVMHIGSFMIHSNEKAVEVNRSDFYQFKIFICMFKF